MAVVKSLRPTIGDQIADAAAITPVDQVALLRSSTPGSRQGRPSGLSSTTPCGTNRPSRRRTPLCATEVAAPSTDAGVIEIRLGSAIVRVGADVTGEHLTRVLLAVKAAG